MIESLPIFDAVKHLYAEIAAELNALLPTLHVRTFRVELRRFSMRPDNQRTPVPQASPPASSSTVSVQESDLHPTPPTDTGGEMPPELAAGTAAVRGTGEARPAPPPQASERRERPPERASQDAALKREPSIEPRLALPAISQPSSQQ